MSVIKKEEILSSFPSSYTAGLELLLKYVDAKLGQKTPKAKATKKSSKDTEIKLNK